MRSKEIILAWIVLFCAGVCQSIAGENCPKTRFFYIRHGEVSGNDTNPATYIYTGSRTDDSLTEKGKIQAQNCAKRISNLQKSGAFGKITALYASDLKRALETAEPIAKALDLSIQLRYNLREIDWGCADGQLVEKMAEEYATIEQEIKNRYSERKMRWDYLPVFAGAETYNALLKRTLEEFKFITGLHEGETVFIVGHGRVIKTLLADIRDSEEKIPYPANCGIVEFTYSLDEGLRFVQILETNHT